MDAVDISSEFAYVKNNGDLEILTMNSRNPLEQVLTYPQSSLRDIRVKNEYIYAAIDRELLIIKHDPRGDLSVVNSIDAVSPWSLKIHNDYLFMCDLAEGVKIIDISEPESAFTLETVKTRVCPLRTEFYNDHLFIYGNGLEIIQLEDMRYDKDKKPVISRYNIKDAVFYENNIFALDNYGVFIYDMNDNNHEPIGRYDLPGNLSSLEIHKNTAYIAAGPAGLHLLDISSPSNPMLVSTVTLPETVTNLAISDDYGYVAGEYTGLHIIRLDPPEQARHVKSIEPVIDVSYFRCVESVVVMDKIAYLAVKNSGFYMYDISEPAVPVLIGHFDIPKDMGSSSDRISINYFRTDGNYLCVVYNPFIREEGSHIYILNTKPLEDIRVLSSLTATSALSDVCIIDNRMLVGEYQTVTVYDLSNPDEPEKIGSCLIDNHIRRLRIFNGIMVIVDCSGGLNLYDISNLDGKSS